MSCRECARVARYMAADPELYRDVPRMCSRHQRVPYLESTTSWFISPEAQVWYTRKLQTWHGRLRHRIAGGLSRLAAWLLRFPRGTKRAGCAGLRLLRAQPRNDRGPWSRNRRGLTDPQETLIATELLKQPGVVGVEFRTVVHVTVVRAPNDHLDPEAMDRRLYQYAAEEHMRLRYPLVQLDFTTRG